jgi:sodium-dependent phosphate cotransporter
MLGTHMADLIQKTINAEIPYVPWLTGYIGILIGTVITILVRSSSVFTSTLTPLCGAGLVSLETAYPMTLGSNIGTTTTALLASFAAEGKYLKPSVQTALVHLFFNIIGILIFYPIPCMRWPLPLARSLGNLTAEYRWFAAFDLVSMFFLLPALIFLLSLAGPIALYMVVVPIILLVVSVAIINTMQQKKPSWLPPFLRNWEFLPLWMRSLKPIDNVFSKLRCCQKCQGDAEQVAVEDEQFDDIEAGQGNHVSIIKLKTRDSNANAVNELESLVVNGYGPPKIMQNADIIGVEVEEDPATEMRKNGKIVMSNGHGIYGKPKG